MEGKICTKCGVWKPLEEFNKNKTRKDGRQYECRECTKEYKKQWSKNNPKYNKQWRENNPNYYKQWHLNNAEQQKQYRENNKEHKKEYDKQYRKDNTECIKEYMKQWYEINKECKKEYDKQRRENIKENNIQNISNMIEQINPILKGLPIYGYIYKFENIKTGHMYLGQTTQLLKARYGTNIIKSWIKERKSYENQKFLDELIEEDFVVTELFDVGICQYHLDKIEAYWINYYDSCNNGYNNNAGYYDTDDGIEEFNRILKENNLKFINGKLEEI